MQSSRCIYFSSDTDSILISIKENPTEEYSSFTWPSSLVLSLWLISNRNRFPSSSSRFLEIGSGTGLVGLVCSSLGFRATLTDYQKATLETIKESSCLNCSQELIETEILDWSQPSTWRSFIDTNGSDFEYIISSDVFYDPQDFECILAMISFFLSQCPGCNFITAYQERSAKRSISYLLDKWRLKAQQISFDFRDCGWQISGSHWPPGTASVFLFAITLDPISK